MGCSDIVPGMFKLKKLLPTGEDPLLFVNSQWGDKEIPQWYIIYRVAAAVFMPIWVALDCVTEYRHFYPTQPGVWFIFATNWAFLLLACNTIFQAVLVVHYHHFASHSQTEMPKLYSAFWILYNIVSNSALIITLSFWIFMSFLMTEDYMSSTWSELKHSLSGVYVIVDLFVTSIPIRFLHFVYPTILGLAYTIFNAVYFLSGGEGPNGEPYTYYVLYWKKPAEALTTTALESLLSMMMQLLLVMLYKLRLYIHEKLQKNREYQLCGSCQESSEEQSLLQKPDNNEFDAVK